MTLLKIAVVGAGIIGKAHMDLLVASEHCDLAAVVDPCAQAKALAQAKGAAYFTSLDELLTQARPDGIILATPNHRHVEQALACIAAGVPVLIEKPVAHTLDEGRKLLDAARSADAKCLVGHHRYHSPIIAKAKQIIGENLLGDLVAVSASAMFFKPDDYFEHSPWRTRKGAGPILVNMIHEVGNLRYLCGEIVEVQAMSSNAQRKYEVEDTVALSLRFANGTLGSFMLCDTAACARSWEQTSHENKSYAHYPDEDCYVIAGTEGSLSIPTMRMKRYASKAGRSWWKPFDCTTIELERHDPLAEQLEHFCAVIRGEADPIVTIHDGLQNLRIVEAISLATKSNASVRIPPIGQAMADLTC
ncbi:Gfo/Idh/MocA family protein [Marinobacterium sedimentorum]|uniref:Gfo/Idh/MocA family protein n=1 Tax=Marinobacterium sedimentorum TaxID=2927804 RepID=UPI0020C5B7A2|nr:Gfo/Idh/MocA family oxidoreductase [Marinobacterium sedimentorum]MCP8687610.1 Gfo/Idh/MocA family oxidoreductase [Marinobacterium sedimentorum]